MRACFLVFIGLLAPGWVRANRGPDEPLSLALNQLYNSRFDDSRQTLADYAGTHPADPMPYALRAATYLFGSLDRSGAMRPEFLATTRTVTENRRAPVTPQQRAAMEDAFRGARARATAVLLDHPDDRNALLSMCIVAGVQRDFLALAEHKLRDSYEYMKEAQRYASRLLKVDPTAYDAYMTKGFTEYLVASMPFFLRWMVKIDDIGATKEKGLEDLRIAATSGRYLRPFAQLVLAMFYQREKQDGETEKLLAQLAHEYPENATFRTELARLEAQRRGVAR